jgi:uroporphyrinogen decarboxylase
MDISSKERFRAAVGHRQTDRVPTFSSFTPRLTARLRKELEITEPDIGVALGNDMIQAGIGIEKSNNFSTDPEYVCPWGITWRNVRNNFGYYTTIVENPLAGDEEKLSNWSIPDPSEKKLYSEMEQMLERYGHEYWIAGSCRCSLFESAWYLRGLDQFLLDLLTNEEYVDALLDKILEFPRYSLLRYIEMGADMVWMGDDISSQQGMMISPELWRRFLKPRYAKLFREFKEANPDIVIAYHSCGNCEAILDEMIEIGLDVLHPVQPQAIDPIATKGTYGDRLTLMGGLDIQLLMPNGSPADVSAEVKRLIRGCGKDGGFILGGAHHFQEDTPTENILALYESIAACTVTDGLFIEPVRSTEEVFEELKRKLNTPQGAKA